MTQRSKKKAVASIRTEQLHEACETLEKQCHAAKQARSVFQEYYQKAADHACAQPTT